ncbi:hypothetical protein M404DRAFT_17151 [Pisolithus tinctorius Marx 270]|uniref:DDE Tnp4 domain-containing protein n=1 Tax=Pisolithus tinctorius Marx 270 TaxID=870435 RepID=A0A0C3NH34_PISTI|nr:hypothetical protein M404DRAFT_17151 [Pisolithus tinctorius Marx 270]
MSTPWQKLYESQDDWAFIMTMGFDVETFGYILTSGFAAAWYHTPIPQNDTNTTGNPWPSCRSLDAAGALGLVLHYLNSTMHEISLQQIFAIIPATVSWYITFGFLILLSTLKNMPEGQIHWPKHDEFDELSQLRTPDGYYLVADTAFPCGTADILGCICTPLKDGQWISGTPNQMVGINQIQTVYLQSWQQTNEDQEVWTGFAEMLFSDQIKKDHVSHFHITFKYE